MADQTPPLSYSSDPTLYLYTSLTAGSSHIITASSRLETILKANRIPFMAIDVATDEKARMLWGRRSKGKKLPGLVRFGMVVGDLEQIEEWNEYGELKDQIRATDPSSTGASTTPATDSTAKAPTAPANAGTPKLETSPPPRPSSTPHIGFKGDEGKEDNASSTPETGSPKRDESPSITLAIRQAGAEAAKKAGEKKAEKTAALKASLNKNKDADGAGEPVASQVREASTPLPEAVAQADPSDQGKGDHSSPSTPTGPSIPTEALEFSSPPPPASHSLGGDPPPLHYSPKPTPALTSSSSLELSEAEAKGELPIEHHRESKVSMDVPKEIIKQVESNQAIVEDPDAEKKEEKEAGAGAEAEAAEDGTSKATA